MRDNNEAIVYQSKLHLSEIKISGYKHCATVIIAASLINTDTVIELHNVPRIDDIKYMTEIIIKLGGAVDYYDNKLLINPKQLCDYKVPEEYSQHIHGAIYLLPVLLGRFKRVELGNCGGCQIGNTTFIGKRPIDHMLSILEKFGANFQKENGKILGSINSFNECTIDIMDYSEEKEILTGPLISGATKTAILAAAAVRSGKTKIINFYPKPDVTELLKFMEQIGYIVTYGTNFIEISPAQMQSKQLSYNLMSDISQIMTYISLSVYHDIPLLLTNITVDKVKKGLETEISYLEKMGIKLRFMENAIKIDRIAEILPLHINVTSVGIYSDHQPFFALMFFRANGFSSIKEYVWKSRFAYAKQLLMLGFRLNLEGNTLEIIPSEPNKSNQILHADDLRAAAVLLIASLKVPGQTTIKSIHHLTRGYDHFIDDLISLGAKIEVM